MCNKGFTLNLGANQKLTSFKIYHKTMCRYGSTRAMHDSKMFLVSLTIYWLCLRVLNGVKIYWSFLMYVGQDQTIIHFSDQSCSKLHQIRINECFIPNHCFVVLALTPGVLCYWYMHIHVLLWGSKCQSICSERNHSANASHNIKVVKHWYHFKPTRWLTLAISSFTPGFNWSLTAGQGLFQHQLLVPGGIFANLPPLFHSLKIDLPCLIPWSSHVMRSGLLQSMTFGHVVITRLCTISKTFTNVHLKYMCFKANVRGGFAYWTQSSRLARWRVQT